MDSQNHFKTNLTVGLVGAPIVDHYTNVNTLLLMVLMVIFISLSTLPDIDAKTDILQHRGYSHTILGCILFGGIPFGVLRFINRKGIVEVSMYFSVLIFSAVYLSCLTHIIADSLTEGGGFTIKPLAIPVLLDGPTVSGYLSYDSRVFDIFTKIWVIMSVAFFTGYSLMIYVL